LPSGSTARRGITGRSPTDILNRARRLRRAEDADSGATPSDVQRRIDRRLSPSPALPND
jgi:hypothetical protein